MIQAFVDRFMAAKPRLRERFASGHPNNYKAIVDAVVGVLNDEDDYCSPDPERIEEIDWGDYQGTLLFVIGARGYQPSTFWTVKVGYGSCSGCDTLQGICSYSSEPPTDEQVDQYMTLALHVVQGIHVVGEGN